MRRRLIALIALGILADLPTASAQNFQTYRCRDGSEFVIGFYEGDRFAHVQLDGKAIKLARRLSVQGIRYKKGDITLMFTKAGTALTRGRKTTACRAN